MNDTEEALVEGMRRMMSLTHEQRRDMGARGRAWMARDFSWISVAKKMIALYEDAIAEKTAVSGDKF